METGNVRIDRNLKRVLTFCAIFTGTGSENIILFFV